MSAKVPKVPKVTVDGATWKRFYSDPKLWEPAGECYHEDEAFWVDGVILDENDEKDMDNVPDSARVAVVAGVYYDNQDSYDFVKVFRDWVKAHSADAVAVSRVKLEALEALHKCCLALANADKIPPNAILEVCEAARKVPK